MFIVHGDENNYPARSILSDERNQYSSDSIYLVFSTSTGGGHYDIAVENGNMISGSENIADSALSVNNLESLSNANKADNAEKWPLFRSSLFLHT